MWKTPNKINGITPEEIKSDLLADYGCCSECKYGKSTYDNPYGCAERALKMQVADNAHAYIQHLENREWELFDLLSSAWYGKGCYFKQDDGTVYSRISGEYLSFDKAIDEFASALTTV